MSEFTEIRARAKDLGINSFGKSKTALQELIVGAEMLLDNMEAAGSKSGRVSRPKKAGDKWSWRNRFEITGKRSAAFRYRFVSTEEANLRDKLADGWEFVNSSTGIPGEHIDPRQISDGGQVAGAQTYRDMVLMALPEERAKLRDEAVKELTRSQTVDLKNKAQSSLANPGGPVAEVHGNITIIE